MRRKDREIADIDEKLKIIDQCKVCRLALSESNRPYIVPLNYGYSYEDGLLTLFFHSAPEGRKMEIIKVNSAACFEIDCDNRLITAEIPCQYGYAFKSVVGFGEITIIEKVDARVDALNRIMSHQTGDATVHRFPEEALTNIAVYRLTVKEFTGKGKEFPHLPLPAASA
jgi:nitroimidazol reductase NimA-like FMN-containing flavoprotein (pyridoxamine 5'-phosphate oxidase superfamily)